LIQIYFLLVKLNFKSGDPLAHAKASLFLILHHQIEWDKQFNVHFSMFAKDGEETRDIFVFFINLFRFTVELQRITSNVTYFAMHPVTNNKHMFLHKHDIGYCQALESIKKVSQNIQSSLFVQCFCDKAKKVV
jgi:hypothetical protein